MPEYEREPFVCTPEQATSALLSGLRVVDQTDQPVDVWGFPLVMDQEAVSQAEQSFDAIVQKYGPKKVDDPRKQQIINSSVNKNLTRTLILDDTPLSTLAVLVVGNSSILRALGVSDAKVRHYLDRGASRAIGEMDHDLRAKRYGIDLDIQPTVSLQSIEARVGIFTKFRERLAERHSGGNFSGRRKE